MKTPALIAVAGALLTAMVLFAVNMAAWPQRTAPLEPVTLVLPAAPKMPTLDMARPAISEAAELRATYADNNEAFFVELIRYDQDRNPYAYDVLVHHGQNMVLTQRHAVRCDEVKLDVRITPLEREHVTQICGAVWPTPEGG